MIRSAFALVASCLVVCGLPAVASAIGLCEGLVDTAQVVAISESAREVAVRRAVERCREGRDGTESRRMIRYVEMRNLDTGQITRRFSPDKTTDTKAVSEALEKPVSDWASYTKALHDDLFQALPATGKNRFCRASLSLDKGDLVAVIDGRDRRNKPVRATVRILPDVEPGSRPERLARLWFARHGTVLVADIEAPVVVRQGALGNTTVHRSLVSIIGPKVAPVLRGCATPRPEKRRPKKRR